jgi:cyclopropane fatty-acyl-phospholipid synthase-like methyltransferase
MDEAQKPPAIQASKRLMLERIALAPGEAVLDVGCGPGTDVFDMAELVGPNGHLVGLDASEVMIAEARRRAKELKVFITFEVGSRTARSSCAAPNDCWSTSPMPSGRSRRWFG